MKFFYSRPRLPASPDSLFKKLRIEWSKNRLSFIPGHFRSCFVVNEVIETQCKTRMPSVSRRKRTSAGKQNNFLKLLFELGLTVGSQTHHLVFVSVFGKAKILCNCRVEYPQ